jgi:uncharacterized SAM-binding protein YcdF (DUF218 family)
MERKLNNMKKKKWLLLLWVITALLLMFFFRYNILTAAGNFLIVEDNLKPCTYAFVLSGGPWDRGNEAARLFKEGMADTLVCTGENIPHDFKALGLNLTESEITEKNLINQGIPQGNILLIRQGTSTQEESEIILSFCKQKGVKQIIVISTDFHTRRISQVFKRKFRQENIEVLICAAPSSSYDARQWWKSENGLIALNNEYIKQLYYLIKY